MIHVTDIYLHSTSGSLMRFFRGMGVGANSVHNVRIYCSISTLQTSLGFSSITNSLQHSQVHFSILKKIIINTFDDFGLINFYFKSAQIKQISDIHAFSYFHNMEYQNIHCMYIQNFQAGFIHIIL